MPIPTRLKCDELIKAADGCAYLDVYISSHCDQQAQFMQAMGSPMGEDGAKLSALLIDEEVNKELIPALNTYLSGIVVPGVTKEDMLCEVADGIVDSVYVLYQLANSLGINFDACFAEVHRSNMSKRQPDGTVKRREDGKILKPDSFSPPNLKPIMLHEGATA